MKSHTPLRPQELPNPTPSEMERLRRGLPAKTLGQQFVAEVGPVMRAGVLGLPYAVGVAGQAAAGGLYNGYYRSLQSGPVTSLRGMVPALQRGPYIQDQRLSGGSRSEGMQPKARLSSTGPKLPGRA